MVIGGIFGMFGCLLVDGNLANMSSPQNLSLKQNFICQGTGLIGTLLVVFLFRRYSDLSSLISMGFSIKGRLNDILLGFVLPIFIISTGTIILVRLNQLNIVSIKFNGSDCLFGILLFSVVSVGEEILCRGYILNNLMSSINKYRALLITSVIFALLHGFNSNLSWIGMVNLLLAGVLLGSTYIYTKNLWFPISLHLFWNFIQGCVFDYNVSGMDVNSFFLFDIPINNSFNGGDFGFEGSILCTILTIVAIASIHLWYQKKSLKAYSAVFNN
jgi:membrane protease YdiL (CAAX protease family)